MILAVRMQRTPAPQIASSANTIDLSEIADAASGAPLQLPAVAPVPVGVSVHEMTDEQLLGVLVSGGMAEEQVLDALREGRERRIVGFVEGAVHALKSDSYLVRVETLKLLAELGDRRAVPEILVVLDDEDPVVREYGARALGALADPRSLAYLSSRLVREDDPAVKKAIKSAIDQINGYKS